MDLCLRQCTDSVQFLHLALMFCHVIGRATVTVTSRRLILVPSLNIRVVAQYPCRPLISISSHSFGYPQIQSTSLNISIPEHHDIKSKLSPSSVIITGSLIQEDPDVRKNLERKLYTDSWIIYPVWWRMVPYLQTPWSWKETGVIIITINESAVKSQRLGLRSQNTKFKPPSLFSLPWKDLWGHDEESLLDWWQDLSPLSVSEFT